MSTSLDEDNRKARADAANPIHNGRMSGSRNDRIMELFAERLRRYREREGFTSMEQFARAIGIEGPAYRRYERGEVAPSFETLERICTVLKITPNDLLPVGRQPRKPPKKPAAEETA